MTRFDPAHPEEFPERVVKEAEAYTRKMAAAPTPRRVDVGLLPAPTVGKLEVITNLFAENPNDAKTYSFKLDWTRLIPLPDLFAQTPTAALYNIRDLIEKELGKRPDARR